MDLLIRDSKFNVLICVNGDVFNSLMGLLTKILTH